MSETAADISTADTSRVRMPDRVALVAETLARFDVTGDRHRALELDTVTLRDVGVLLATRGTQVSDAWASLNESLGMTEDEPAVPRSSFYRFADRFRAVYGQVRAEHAARVAKLNVAHATDGNIQAMTRLARHRLVELAAQKLVDTDDVEDVAKLLGSLASVVSDAADHDLKQRDLVRKLEESDAKVERLTLENDERKRRLEAAINAAKKAVQSADKDPSKTALNSDDVIAILDRVMKGEAA